MGLLAGMDDLERASLQWRLLEAMRDLHMEIALLERCLPDVRDRLYGPDILARFRALRDDITDLLDHDVIDHEPRAELRLGGRDPGIYIDGKKVS